MFEVYCLTSPSGKSYVGFTSQGSDRRWRKHVLDADRGSKLPLHNAIRKHGSEAFTRSLLERMTTEAGAKQAERLWIKELGTFGRGGYNATLGGEGMLGHVPSVETRAKVAKARRNLSPELRARFANTQRGKIASSTARVNMAAAQRGRKHTPETRAKMAESKLGNKHAQGKKRSPETLARMAAAHFGKKHSPESRAKMSKPKRISDETRAAMAETARSRVFTSETRAKIADAGRGRKHTPETRNKIGQANRGRKHSPEACARMSAAATLREANKKLKREGN